MKVSSPQVNILELVPAYVHKERLFYFDLLLPSDRKKLSKGPLTKMQPYPDPVCQGNPVFAHQTNMIEVYQIDCLILNISQPVCCLLY